VYPLTIGVAIEHPDLADAVRATVRELPVRLLLDGTQLGGWDGFVENARKGRLDVAIVDISKAREPLEEMVRQVKSACPDAMIVALNTSADPEVILRAIRAGVHEYLFPPVSDALVKALERKSEEIREQKAARKTSGRVIGVLSSKGGCGSTTVACHVAAELARSEQRVLLADFDIDSGIIAFLMKSKSAYSVADAAVNLNRLDYNYWSALTSNGMPNLDVISAPAALAARRTLRADQLRPVLGFVRSHYDWTIADLGRNLNRIALAVLDEIDEAFLVTTFDVPALHQTQLIVRSLLETGYGRNRVRLVLNQAPKRMDITPEELEKMLGLPVYATLPNESSELYEAYSEGKLLGRGTNLGKHFQKVAAKLAGVQEEPARKKGFTAFFGL
jgi:pilus assembly protein CpaE